MSRSTGGVDLNFGYDGPESSQTEEAFALHHDDVHFGGFNTWAVQTPVNPHVDSTPGDNGVTWYGSSYEIDAYEAAAPPVVQMYAADYLDIDAEGRPPSRWQRVVRDWERFNDEYPKLFPLVALLSFIPAMVLNQAWKRRQVPPWYQDSLNMEMFNPGEDGFVTHYNIGRSEMVAPFSLTDSDHYREAYQFYWRRRAFQQANREWELDEL